MYAGNAPFILAADSVAAKLSVIVGWKQTPSGRETPVYASVRVPGRPMTTSAAFALLAAVKMTKVSTPNNDKGAVITLRLSPSMSGLKAAILFAYKGELLSELPESISEETIESVLKSAGILTETAAKKEATATV